MSKAIDIPAQQLRAYNRLIDSHPEIERKGKTMPYTSLHGNMFTHLDSTGSLGLRLSPQDRKDFIEKYQTTIYEQYGRQMKEYVTVPDALLLNTKELIPYLQNSLDYVKTLKPKATKGR